MPTPRRATRTVLLALALTAAMAPAASADALLFVQTADGGSLERVKGERYRLELTGVTATDVFTDRPARRASRESARRFVRAWRARGFARSAPNAALAIDGARKGRDVLMVTLRRPRYDRRRATLSYVATPLRGQAPRALRAFARRGDRVRELRFGRASLFVDDGNSTTYLPLTIVVQGMGGGESLELELPGAASSGVQFSQGAGLGRSQLVVETVVPDAGSLDLEEFRFNPSVIEVVTGGAGAPGEGFQIAAYLAVSGSVPSTVATELAAPSGTQLSVYVGDGDPQVLLPGSGTLGLE